MSSINKNRKEQMIYIKNIEGLLNWSSQTVQQLMRMYLVQRMSEIDMRNLFRLLGEKNIRCTQ